MTTHPTVGFDRQALKEATRFLTALGDPMRLQILYLLGDQGRRNVSDIAGNFHLSRPAISHHLKVLKDAGVVDSERVGQEIYYGIERDRIVATLQMLADAAAAWECPL
jgi:ArsR family transcriptional regulator, arsenate/arsenite/antimonite-responsive transcriptional repressor